MDVNQIQAYSAYSKSSGMNTIANKQVHDANVDISDKKHHGKKLLENAAGVLVEDTPAAVYEKSDIVAIMKKDAQARADQLREMVSNALRTQAGISEGEDDVWKLLSSGKFTVSEAAKKEAQELISEDGYYGAKQTSDRILEFAKALSGNDKSKADELLNAFKKGYQQATKSWGKELPDICKQTYDEVERKFNEWRDSTE